MKNELALNLPASCVTKNALLIDTRATDKQVGELGFMLAQIDGARSFWLGDYGLFLQNRKRKELIALSPDADPEVIETRGHKYLADKAEAMGIDAHSWTIYISVSKFYDVSVRTDMSFAHHYVAMNAAGGVTADVRRAIEWLHKAEKNGWPVSKLRRVANETNKTAKDPEQEPLKNDWEPIDELDGWIQREVKELDFTPDYARSQLVRFANIIAFIEKLKELAK
jgi:hypothetical protein